MATNVSNNPNINDNVSTIDDYRRRLGIASLHGKIKSCVMLLDYANKIGGDAAKSYEDPAQSEAHLYSCIEGIYTALAEVIEHSQTSQVLCQKIVGDKSVLPLDKFSNAMRTENGIL